MAKVQGFLDAKTELNKRGFDFADSTYHRAIEVICGFDKAMDELHDLAINGPHVTYKKAIIPLAGTRAGKRSKK